jgi:GNAT superfamily N-acetyltransferase
LVGIGAFAAKSFLKQRHAGTISHLYVKERFRRKGVAGLLLGAVLELLIMLSRWRSWCPIFPWA